AFLSGAVWCELSLSIWVALSLSGVDSLRGSGLLEDSSFDFLFPSSNTAKEEEREIRVSAKMIEVVLNDRLGKKVRVKCNEDDTIGDLKKLVAAQTGTRADKIRIQKWYNIYKDHITLKDYEIHDGMGLELYYN
ncbi:hypothetical protein EUGRSUZ_J00924, partial [Eucalyptus grandis]